METINIFRFKPEDGTLIDKKSITKLKVSGLYLLINDELISDRKELKELKVNYGTEVTVRNIVNYLKNDTLKKFKVSEEMNKITNNQKIKTDSEWIDHFNVANFFSYKKVINILISFFTKQMRKSSFWDKVKPPKNLLLGEEIKAFQVYYFFEKYSEIMLIENIVKEEYRGTTKIYGKILNILVYEKILLIALCSNSRIMIWDIRNIFKPMKIREYESKDDIDDCQSFIHQGKLIIKQNFSEIILDLSYKIDEETDFIIMKAKKLDDKNYIEFHDTKTNSSDQKSSVVTEKDLIKDLVKYSERLEKECSSIRSLFVRQFKTIKFVSFELEPEIFICIISDEGVCFFCKYSYHDEDGENDISGDKVDDYKDSKFLFLRQVFDRFDLEESTIEKLEVSTSDFYTNLDIIHINKELIGKHIKMIKEFLGVETSFFFLEEYKNNLVQIQGLDETKKFLNEAIGHDACSLVMKEIGKKS